MPRILYAAFDPVPAPKGASRHILAFLRGLVAAGLDVDVCVLTDHERLAGARCLPCPLPEGSIVQRALAFGQQVLQHARAGDYDLVHVRSIWEGLPILGLSPRPPLLVEVNGLPSYEWPETYPKLAGETELLGKIRRQEQALVRGADGLITPSPVTAELLRNWGGETVNVVPNGVDLEVWMPGCRETLNAKLPEILYMGTFSPWQGLTTLLHAFARLPPPWLLRLVGTRHKGQGAELLHLAQQLGVADRVLIQPPVAPSVLRRLLTRSRVAVAPLSGGDRNRVQGACPVKILEYLAVGCPVVASRLPLVETMVRHGESAWLVEPDDADALADGLWTVLNDPTLASRLAVQGQAIAQQMTWARSVGALIDVYGALGVSPVKDA